MFSYMILRSGLSICLHRRQLQQPVRYDRLLQRFLALLWVKDPVPLCFSLGMDVCVRPVRGTPPRTENIRLLFQCLWVGEFDGREADVLGVPDLSSRRMFGIMHRSSHGQHEGFLETVDVEMGTYRESQSTRSPGSRLGLMRRHPRSSNHLTSSSLKMNRSR